MKLVEPPGSHLTYCTNIHPGESWADVRANLSTYVLSVKRRIAPEQPFGVGLRLSARAAVELDTPPALAELEAFLDANDLYVFTINGFPYGSFHATRVKEAVYRPDWREDERLDYTNRLASLLARLLPEDREVAYGSVSTVPAAYRDRIGTSEDQWEAGDRLIRHAAFLHTLAESSGRTITLALEPEPDCHLETTLDAVAFFERCLYGDRAVRRMSEQTGLVAAEAELALKRHLRLCLDTCHAAVEFEDVDEMIGRLHAAQVGIAKIQVSAGLRLSSADRTAIDALEAFADDVYLHQVAERSDGRLTRYRDLPDALDARRHADAPAGGEWRVHFHVPLFRERLGRLANTQDFVRRVLAAHRERPLTDHLEVETYTWDVLPAQFRDQPVADAVARELGWVLEALASRP